MWEKHEKKRVFFERDWMEFMSCGFMCLFKGDGREIRWICVDFCVFFVGMGRKL